MRIFVGEDDTGILFQVKRRSTISPLGPEFESVQTGIVEGLTTLRKELAPKSITRIIADLYSHVV